jgi:hypothetical protein
MELDGPVNRPWCHSSKGDKFPIPVTRIRGTPVAVVCLIALTIAVCVSYDRTNVVSFVLVEYQAYGAHV